MQHTERGKGNSKTRGGEKKKVARGGGKPGYGSIYYLYVHTKEGVKGMGKTR